MKVSYKWLKSYVPELPEAKKLRDIFTYHLCEVESMEERAGDTIFDINILPNRAHDLLSHQGVARELASLLDFDYREPVYSGEYGYFLGRKFLVLAPSSSQAFPKQTGSLKIEVESEKCRRYMGRIVRNVKVGSSPVWVKEHLESIGQRSINNIVDAANIVMYDLGQPIHAFDLDKVKGKIIIRSAEKGEKMTTLDGKNIVLEDGDLVIADEKDVLAIAGVKGGKKAEVDDKTKNIIIEVANFDPVSVRKTARRLHIFTDAAKRFENGLSPELCISAMAEMCGLIAEYGNGDFEEVVDVYPEKQKERKLVFSAEKISKILGMDISVSQIEGILKRYNFGYKEKSGKFEITVPPLRLDLEIEEDMAEEIGRILGYDKVQPKIPRIKFKPKTEGVFYKMLAARKKLLDEGYSEVMTYTFRDKGEVQVMESASDKKFLRTNLSDGLKESLKLNQPNAPLLGIDEIKIFEIGTVFNKKGEQINIAYGDKKKVTEVSLDEFCKNLEINNKILEPRTYTLKPNFQMWSLFPFISRDIAVWVKEGVESNQVYKVIKQNAGELLAREPKLFDKFSKDGKTSYAFRLVFQSYDRTLSDEEVNGIMQIVNKAVEKNSWQVR